jgi:large subunit ribosomal protein L6
MKSKIAEKTEIPSGISCVYQNNIFTCTKSGVSLSRRIEIPRAKLSIKGNEIFFDSEKGNKNQFKMIKSNIAHIKNLFQGLNEKFVYSLEACNVHFPMTLKIEPGKLIINNFLGEKVPRKAVILPEVNVDIKGVKITVTSHNREHAGQTAANIEKATKIRNRDRRVFQDGIYITERPGRQM